MIVLRVSAAEARSLFLGRLKPSLAAALGSTGKGAKEKAAQLRLMITEIETQRQGAFSPLTEDPLLYSLLLPFGGVGGLLFIERLLAFLQ